MQFFVVWETWCHCEERAWPVGKTSLGFLTGTAGPFIWVFPGGVMFFQLKITDFFLLLCTHAIENIEKMRKANYDRVELCYYFHFITLIGKLDSCIKEAKRKIVRAHSTIGWRRQRRCNGTQGNDRQFRWTCR